MSVLGTVLLVFFVIVAVLLILLVLAQNEEGNSLGGIFAGGSGSAFGSRTGNVLTKTTTVLGALFLIISLLLAIMNRSPSGTGVERQAQQLAPDTATSSDWWEEDPVVPEPYVFPEDIESDDGSEAD
ncbi:MAG: preprotein translocase subunit SecG [Treponema sp.]|jgi:preprotein translocase subunit SecG|nr:preprotein translocase subunit SecG [Treponema sp.]